MQHAVVGGFADMIALAHGLSSIGLQVAAIVIWDPSTTRTRTTHTAAICDTFILMNEREKETRERRERE